MSSWGKRYVPASPCLLTAPARAPEVKTFHLTFPIKQLFSHEHLNYISLIFISSRKYFEQVTMLCIMSVIDTFLAYSIHTYSLNYHNSYCPMLGHMCLAAQFRKSKNHRRRTVLKGPIKIRPRLLDPILPFSRVICNGNVIRDLDSAPSRSHRAP